MIRLKSFIIAAILCGAIAAAPKAPEVDWQLAIHRSQLRALIAKRASAPEPKHKYLDSRIQKQREIIRLLHAEKKKG